MATLTDKIEITVPENGLKQKLSLGRPLNVKLGFDPTAPDLHLGHAVVLKKLREFQDAGHNIVVIIGDFTARIGDPTGRNTSRPPLSEEAVQENARTYVNQLSKILDINKITVRFNSEWFGKMKFEDTLKLLSKMTVAQMMQRNDFNNRFNAGQSIALHELVYPVMQGYDSVVIKADVEIGGTDQLFNCMVGKELQDGISKETQIVICMPLLRGTDGKEKMSKSKNNYIGLTENPEDIFGKIMSIPDELLPEYLDLATNFSVEKAAELKSALSDGSANPMDVKKMVAEDIVAQYHDIDTARLTAQAFYSKIQKKDLNDSDYADVHLDKTTLDLSQATLLDLCQHLTTRETRSAVRRLIVGNGVSVNGQKASDSNQLVSEFGNEFKLKIGKRNFFRIFEQSTNVTSTASVNDQPKPPL